MRAGVRSTIFPCSAASPGSAVRPRCWGGGRGSPRSRREGATAAGSGLRADSFPERKPWSQPPAPHARQLSSNRSRACPDGGSAWGAGTRGKGCRLAQSPAAPLRTWGSAPTALKTRCEPRARFCFQPSPSLLLQLGTAQRCRGGCIPAGCTTAAGSSGQRTPGWRGAAIGGFCLIPWNNGSIKAGP